jgi:outer membrane protein, heavy metal efflux system
VLERGARARRVEAASAGRTQLEAERAERRMDVAAETARRYYRVLSDQERLRLTHEATVLAERAVEAARVRVRAAQAPDAELARAEAQLARTRLDHEDVEHELLTARHELAALWGATTPDFGLAQGDLLALPEIEAFDALARRIDANPSLLKFTSTRALREAELRLAEQKRRSPWTVSAGIRRFESGDDFAAVAGLTIPLALRDPARGEVAAAQARLEQVEVERSASALRVRTQLFGWLQELAHARHAADTLDREVIPRMSAALQQTEYAYQRGRYGYAELVAAQRELLEVKRARIQVAVDAYRYATEIDRLTGELPGRDAAEAASRSTTN